MRKLLLLIYETLLLISNWVDVITGNVVFKEMYVLGIRTDHNKNVLMHRLLIQTRIGSNEHRK